MPVIYPDLLFRNPLYLSKREFRIIFLRNRHYLTGSVLDVGCGIKPFKALLKGQTYIALERKFAVDPDVSGSADSLPFRAESFDSVICSEVLEHVPEPLSVLSECFRVLKTGGTLYLSAPMMWYLHYEPHDYYRYTSYGIRYLCEKAGFHIVRIERMGGLALFLCLRLSEFLHRLLYKNVFFPLKYFGKNNLPARKKLATICLVPYQLAALGAVTLFDRFSPRDARGWVVVADKK